MATQLTLSHPRGRVSGSPAPPTHMWFTHAPSGESNGRKMCAGLNPETQLPKAPAHSTPSRELSTRPICHSFAGPSTILGPQWFSQALREGPALPPVPVPLSPKAPLTHAWAFASQSGQIGWKLDRKRKPQDHQTSTGYLVSPEALPSLAPPPPHLRHSLQSPSQTCRHQQAVAFLQPQTWPKHSDKFTGNFQSLWA